LPAYSCLGHKEGDFPVTEKAAQEILSLPMFAELSSENFSYISRLIENYYDALFL